MLILLVNLIRLDSSMARGRVSPGKKSMIFFQGCMPALAWGGRAFPLGLELALASKGVSVVVFS